MNEAVKFEEINPCAGCQGEGCAVCHREEKGGE